MGILEFEQFFSTSLWTVLYIPFKCFGKKNRTGSKNSNWFASTALKYLSWRFFSSSFCLHFWVSCNVFASFLLLTASRVSAALEKSTPWDIKMLVTQKIRSSKYVYVNCLHSYVSQRVLVKTRSSLTKVLSAQHTQPVWDTSDAKRSASLACYTA